MQPRRTTETIRLPLGSEAKRRGCEWMPGIRSAIGWALAGMLAGAVMVGYDACQKAGAGQCLKTMEIFIDEH